MSASRAATRARTAYEPFPGDRSGKRSAYAERETPRNGTPTTMQIAGTVRLAHTIAVNAMLRLACRAALP